MEQRKLTLSRERLGRSEMELKLIFSLGNEQTQESEVDLLSVMERVGGWSRWEERKLVDGDEADITNAIFRPFALSPGASELRRIIFFSFGNQNG